MELDIVSVENFCWRYLLSVVRASLPLLGSQESTISKLVHFNGYVNGVYKLNIIRKIYGA